MSLQAIRFDSSIPMGIEMNNSNENVTITDTNTIKDKDTNNDSNNSATTMSLKDLNNNNNINNTKKLFDQESSIASSSVIRNSPRYIGFKYKGKSPITDVPELIELCHHFLSTKNINGLAMIARQRGLPPYLRATIWPVLLKYHPYVLNPYITPDEENFDDLVNNEDEIIEKIRFDFKKYLRKGYNSYKLNDKNNEENNEINSDLFEIQKQIFNTIERAILKFLKKWGTLINYNTGLTWVAIGLAEWLPPLQNSNFVLCGYDDIAKNGTKLRNLHDNSFERFHPNSFSNINIDGDSNSSTTGSYSDNNDPFNSSSVSSNSNSNSSDHSTNPLNQSNPFKPMTFAEVYERLLLVILHTPEPNSSDNTNTNGGDNNTNNNNNNNNNNYNNSSESGVIDIPPSSLSHSQSNPHSPSSTPSPLSSSTSNILSSSSEIHQSDNSSSKSDDMPIFGGSIDDRFSFFLYCLRKCLPELSQYLSDESCLNAKSNKGEWITWWVKWCGAKSWSRYDRGRVWDMLLGWRPSNTIKDLDLKKLDLEIDEENLRCLGTEIFWCSSFNDNSSSNSSISSSIEPSEEIVKRSNRRNSSIKTLIDSVSIRKLSIHTQNENVFEEEDNNDGDDDSNSTKDYKLKDLPFSRLNPHFEFIFVAIAFLKSKEFALLELEQSEIKEFLNRISSQRIEGFQAGLENEVKETINKSKLINNGNKSKLTPSPEKQSLPITPLTNTEDSSIYTLSNVSGSLTPIKTTISSNIDNFDLKLSNLSIGPTESVMTETNIPRTHNNNNNHHVVETSSSSTPSTSVSVSFLKNNDHIPRKTSRDIENIIVEAGELWRKFLFKELEEEEKEKS